MNESERQQAHIYVQAAKNKAWKQFESVHVEAHESMSQAHYAMDLIHDSSSDEAKAVLIPALAMMRDIELPKGTNLVLFSHEVESFEYLEKPETAEKDVAYVRYLLDAMQIQEARQFLDKLRSEIVIAQAFIEPPKAISHIEQTLELLNEEKSFAVEPLEKLFNDLDIEENVRPLPLIIAQAALKNASRLPENEKEKMMVQLTMVQEQIEVAHILGYTHQQSDVYEQLSEQVRGLSSKVRETNDLELLYEIALNKMTELTNLMIFN